MQLTLCYCCPACAPPCAPAPVPPPAAAADRDADGGGYYEELPVSVPPHVPQGLSRDALLDRWEEGAYAEAVEQQLAVPPDRDGAETGSAAGAAGPSSWRLWVACASVCRRAVPS